MRTRQRRCQLCAVAVDYLYTLFLPNKAESQRFRVCGSCKQAYAAKYDQEKLQKLAPKHRRSKRSR